MAAKSEKDIILAHTAQWFQNSEWSMERFAHDLLAPVLEADGHVEGLVGPQDGESFIKARKAWRQRVDRIFNGALPFPLEWKWSWINAMAEPFRSEALKDLQLFAGMIPVVRPDLRHVNGVHSSKARIAEVMIEVAEFFQASAPAAEDGRYDRDDHAHAADMVEKGLEAVGAIISEIKAVAAGCGFDLPVGRAFVVVGAK